MRSKFGTLHTDPAATVLSATEGEDSVYVGPSQGNALGLSFRSSPTGEAGYDVIIDRMDGRIKLCRRPQDQGPP